MAADKLLDSLKGDRFHPTPLDIDKEIVVEGLCPICAAPLTHHEKRFDFTRQFYRKSYSECGGCGEKFYD